MMDLIAFRCVDCNERLNDHEIDILDFTECKCEICFQKQIKALKDILPRDYFDEKYGDIE